MLYDNAVTKYPTEWYRYINNSSELLFQIHLNNMQTFFLMLKSPLYQFSTFLYHLTFEL